MLKVNTDYVSLHSKQETLKIIGEFKNKFLHNLQTYFNLVEVDPKCVTKINEVPSNLRNLSYDNYEENTIVQLNPYINNQLINYINNYNFSVNSGVLCYSVVYHRDYKYNLTSTTHEFVIFFQLCNYVSEINEKKIENYVNIILQKVNLIASEIDGSLKKFGKSIHITSMDKLFKQYPLLANNKVIPYANNTYQLMLVYGVNGYNKKNFNILEPKLSAHGPLTATLFAFSPVNNETLKILTVSVVPTIKELNAQIKNNNLKIEDFEYALSTLFEDANSIGIEIYFSQLLMFLMQKYSIHEVVASPTSLQVSKKFSDDHLL